MAIFWASIFIGLAIALAAVGIPYWLTHRTMHPSDPTEAHAYLDAKEEIAQTGDPGQRQRAYEAAKTRRTPGSETR